MLKEKLMTVACAVGILACGACFAPPIIDRPQRPLPPPVQIDLRGIRRIDVVASDASPLKKIDAHNLADQLAIAIDDLSRRTRVKERKPNDDKPADATLQVTVIEETVTLTPMKDIPSLDNWTLTIRVTASLTNLAGQEIWHQAGREYTYSGRMGTQDVAKFWETSSARSTLAYQMCPRLVRSMFYGDSHDY